MRSMMLPLLLPAALVGCGAGEPSADDVPLTAEDTIALAERAFHPALFDTIAWAADSVAFARGAVVWTYSCRKCHGNSGYGDGGFVANGDTVRPPSLLQREWKFAGNRQALRRHIFVGTTRGMPHWGLEGLKPRDIDAVITYIQQGLRYGIEPAGLAEGAEPDAAAK